MKAKNGTPKLGMERKALELRVMPDRILRETCTDVVEFNNQLESLAARMPVFMKEVNGIGLAAPLAGVLRPLVVLDTPDSKQVLVNPQFSMISSDLDTRTEGRLSIPGEMYNVTRFFRIEVRARDIEGKALHFTAQDLHARVIRHESDHLNGMLIRDGVHGGPPELHNENSGID